MADYFSFDEVLGELDLSEDDLKRMVSEGELRAFRDENKMKFKREDVQNLRKGHVSEPTIILPSTPGSQGGNETVLDLDIGQETAELTDAVEASSPAAAGEDMGVIEFAEEPDTGVADDSVQASPDRARVFDHARAGAGLADFLVVRHRFATGGLDGRRLCVAGFSGLAS